MKTILLTFFLSLLSMTDVFSSASLELQVENKDGELKIIHSKTKAGFIEHGGKNYWKVTYSAEPGTYTMTGKNPGCYAVVQSASFEEGKSYTVKLTKDCRIESFSL